MNWPKYFADRLIVENTKSNVGVATLWTPKENVASELEPNSYSVCGQLYTKRGISPMLRNILANPLIRYIVLCGVDRQGSGETLMRFFKDGIVEDAAFGGWRVVGDDEALLDKEIPRGALEAVREGVEVFDLRMKPMAEIAAKISSLPIKRAFGKPQIFPESAPSAVDAYPTDLSVFKVRREYICDAWLDALKIVGRFGAKTPGMYDRVKQVLNLCIVVEKEDPTSPKIPDYMKFRKDGLSKYVKGFFETDKGDEAYTYGERIFDWDGINQADIMVEKLKRFPYDRGALAVLWKPHKDNFPPEGVARLEGGQTPKWRVPCMVMILGQCLGGALNITAVFRNNDVYGAWPLNAFALRGLQKDIAEKIGWRIGLLTTVSHIAEIYEMDWEDSAKIVRENDGLDRVCQWETRSYYTIDVEGDDIVARFFDPPGATQLAEFRESGKKPKAARDLCLMAIRGMLVSDLGAAADLGRQLAKAESAIKLGLKFRQDNELTL